MTEPLARSWSDAATVPFWLDAPGAPEPAEALAGDTDTDLVIVGGGFTGLWAAIQAKELDPTRDVVLLEQDTVGFGASGRNGGFLDGSLTHGLRNGVDRFPEEIRTLERHAAENFDGIRDTIERYGIECDWTPTGTMAVAVEPYQVGELRGAEELLRSFDRDGSVPGPGRGPRRGRLADVPGRRVDTRSHGSRRPGASWRGVCGGRRWSSACASTSTRGRPPRSPRATASRSRR